MMYDILKFHLLMQYEKKDLNIEFEYQSLRSFSMSKHSIYKVEFYRNWVSVFISRKCEIYIVADTTHVDRIAADT